MAGMSSGELDVPEVYDEVIARGGGSLGLVSSPVTPWCRVGAADTEFVLPPGSNALPLSGRCTTNSMMKVGVHVFNVFATDSLQSI